MAAVVFVGACGLLACGSVAGPGGDGGSAGATAGTGGAGIGGGGTTGAAGQAADRCEQGSDCASGACWQQLDGVKDCVGPATAPMPSSCQFAGTGTPCCMSDADCTAKTHGRCVPRTSFPGCGGAIPQGNACVYDECATDADCKAALPAGATVATCLPSGALGGLTAACAYGACRTHADCTKHPGGACQYGLGPTHGQCVLIDVLFCAYPSDPCPAQACSTGMLCVPNDNYQGRQCGPGPPMYP
jgi:hypothetical protein